LLGILPNHAYQNAPRFNTYGQPKAGGFGYETPLQFLFRPQSINMMPVSAMVEPSMAHNKLTNQLTTILCEAFGIEPKDRGCVPEFAKCHTRSEKKETKPPYVCPGCSNHTHGNNMINRCNVIK
jgi:hypothetical protein